MTPTLKEKIEALPEALQKEVERFVDTLAAEPRPERSSGLTFSWAGGLAHLKEEFTSVELQHKASEWRPANPARDACRENV